MNAELLGIFIVASSLLTLSPGPDIVYVMSQSISKGKKNGVAVSLGLTTGLWIHTALVAFGLSVWIVKTPFVFFAIRLLGSLYLIYLALVVFRQKNEGDKAIANRSVQGVNAFQRGLLMNLLNPKVSLFFMAFFPGFIFHDSWSPMVQFFVLGGIFWAQATLIFLSVSYFSNQVFRRLFTHSSSHRAFRWIQVAIYLALGIGLWL